MMHSGIRHIRLMYSPQEATLERISGKKNNDWLEFFVFIEVNCYVFEFASLFMLTDCRGLQCEHNLGICRDNNLSYFSQSREIAIAIACCMNFTIPIPPTLQFTNDTGNITDNLKSFTKYAQFPSPSAAVILLIVLPAALINLSPLSCKALWMQGMKTTSIAILYWVSEFYFFSWPLALTKPAVHCRASTENDCVHTPWYSYLQLGPCRRKMDSLSKDHLRKNM